MMMKAKKIISMLLVGVMAFGLLACCGSQTEIEENTSGDLFELEPAEPYTDADLDWTDGNSRVSVEHENEEERDVELVADTEENFDDLQLLPHPV